MSTTIYNLLGNVLVNGAGKKYDTATIFRKDTPNPIVGLYFSAHWCPPCREFTPILAQFYQHFKMTENGPRLEIVFVSSDHDEATYKQYLSEMPFLGLPFNDRQRKVITYSATVLIVLMFLKKMLLFDKHASY